MLLNLTHENGTLKTYLINCFRATRICQEVLSRYPLLESIDTGKVDKESIGWVVYSCVLLLHLGHVLFMFQGD